VHVDLHHPDLVVYVEVRDKRAYVFSEYLDGPGGLPMGSQGKVVAVIEKRRDALAAWMMMKRGCRVLLLGDDAEAIRILARWDPEPRRISGDLKREVHASKASGVVMGWDLEEVESAPQLEVDVPVYHPLVGMSKEEVEKRLEEISS
jgi:tRNA uracil 4-sulfurtransferase